MLGSGHRPISRLAASQFQKPIVVEDAGHRVQLPRRVRLFQEAPPFTGRKNSSPVAFWLIASALSYWLVPHRSLVVSLQLTVGLLSFPWRLSLNQAGLRLCSSEKGGGASGKHGSCVSSPVCKLNFTPSISALVPPLQSPVSSP